MFPLYLACTELALTITSRRQMAGSPPNLHTMDSRSACIQGVLKVKVKGHVIRALLCWQENRLFSQANDRIKASSLQSNISSISVTFARWKHHCGRSLLSTIALFIFSNTNRLFFSGNIKTTVDTYLLRLIGQHAACRQDDQSDVRVSASFHLMLTTCPTRCLNKTVPVLFFE